MLPPALKLRNIQVAEHMSQETLAFTARLELDGRPIGSVRNDGTGGCHIYSFTDPKGRDAFNRLVRAWATEEAATFEPDDQLVNELVERHEIQKGCDRPRSPHPCRTRALHSQATDPTHLRAQSPTDRLGADVSHPPPRRHEPGGRRGRRAGRRSLRDLGRLHHLTGVAGETPANRPCSP